MTTEPKGPRRVEDFPDCPSEQDIQFVKNTWDQGWAEGYKAGRASRDGLREALFEVTGWASDCYCLSEEEASSPGGKTCPGCVAKEALAEDEKSA